MIITVVTVEGAVKFATTSKARAEEYAKNMRSLWEGCEVKLWHLPVDEG